MLIRFDITNSDLHQLREQIRMPKGIKWLAIAMPVTTVLVIVCIFIFLDPAEPKRLYLIIGLLAYGILGSAFWFWYYKRMKRNTLAILNHPFNSLDKGEGRREVEIDQKNIIIRSSFDSINMEWDKITHPVVYQKDYYLFRTLSQALYIPKRDLPQEEMDRLTKLIISHPRQKKLREKNNEI